MAVEVQWDASNLKTMFDPVSGKLMTGPPKPVAEPCDYCDGETPLSLQVELSDVVLCGEMGTCYPHKSQNFTRGIKVFDVIDLAGVYVVPQLQSGACLWSLDIPDVIGTYSLYEAGIDNYCYSLIQSGDIKGLVFDIRKVDHATLWIHIYTTTNIAFYEILDIVKGYFSPDSGCMAIETDISLSGTCFSEILAASAHVKITEIQ